MASGSEPGDVLGEIRRALEDANIPYMLTGSLASAVYGEPRSTQDIDIVISPDRESLQRLLEHFPRERYYVSAEAAQEAHHNRGMFNVVDLQTGWKVDFIIIKARDFSNEEFNRRREEEVLGLRVFVASPEDVVIAKLDWAKLGESERQIRDAAGILRTQAEHLDVPYIEMWVGRLGLLDQWNAATSAAALGG